MKYAIAILVALLAATVSDAVAQVPLEDLNGDGIVKILAFGDSITLGTGDNDSNARGGPEFGGYPLRLEQALNVLVVNAGRGGEGAGAGSERIAGVVANEHPDYVIILEGANDVNNFEDPNGVVDAMDSMVNSVFASGGLPLLATLTPFCCDKGDRADDARDLSARLRSLASDRGIALVDLHEAFAPGGSFDSGSGLIWNPEGLHPRPLGYDLMADVVAASFSLKPPTPPVLCRGLEPTIMGTPEADVLHGTPGPDVIHGRKGNDSIVGFDGGDVICGGGGDDTLYGSLGNDEITGGKGNDQVYGGDGIDFCKGGLGDDVFPNGACETIEDDAPPTP